MRLVGLDSPNYSKNEWINKKEILEEYNSYLIMHIVQITSIVSETFAKQFSKIYFTYKGKRRKKKESRDMSFGCYYVLFSCDI